jgi:hypothetical protein
MKECGHTFCDECAKACLPTKTCPNCRVGVTGSIPCFYARESIGAMQVKCLLGRSIEDDESNKRKRGNEGDATPADSCDWTGRCEDLKSHEDVCGFKTILCDLDGCNHKCYRKDLSSHLTGATFLHHMNLMKRSFEKNMEEPKQSFEKSMEGVKQSYERKIKRMEQQIVSSERRIQELESMVRHEQNGHHKILVEDAGTDEVNGEYTQYGYEDGAFKYSKKGVWDEKEGEFRIYRCESMDDSLQWWIEFKPEDGRECLFYFAYTNQSFDVPPVNGWRTRTGGKPAPIVFVITESSDISDDE